MPDVRKAVTKEFKKAGNKLVVLGSLDPEKIGGSVYLDTYGERGNALPDWGNQWAKNLPLMYTRLQEIYTKENNPIKSASAIAEGGVFLRLFEGSLGSGFGVNIDLEKLPNGRKDGGLFGEMVGSLLLEIDAETDPADLLIGLPWIEIGQIIESSVIALEDGDRQILTLPMDKLVSVWEKPFAEVVR